MFMLPTHFSKEHKNMFTHTNEILEYHNGNVAIDPRFSKLITALRTAVENGGVLERSLPAIQTCSTHSGCPFCSDTS
jgi:hypothetical protein